VSEEGSQIAAISLKSRLLSGGAWAFTGKMLTALTGLAVNALLARLLAPDEMGAYFLTLSLVSMAAIVAQLGLTQTIVRLIAESMGTGRQGRAKQAIRWTLRLAGISVLIVACFLAFGGGRLIAERMFHSTMMVNAMGLAALWAAVLTFQNLMAEIFRGFHDIRLATLFGGLSTSFLSMLMFVGLWLLQGHSDLNQIIALALVASISSVTLSALVLRKRLTGLPTPPHAISLKDIFEISWPLWVTSLTLFVLTQTDLWILGLFRSQEEVAIYGAATRIVAIVAMPLLIVNAVVPPLIAEMYAQGKKERLERALRSTATMAGLPALAMLIVLFLWGGSLLGLVFGEYYRSGGIILAILSTGQLANVWAGSCGLTLMLTGHQTTMMVITIICGFVTAISALLLVQPYGGVGVANAAAFGMVLQNVLMLLMARKKTGIWTHFGIGLLSKYYLLSMKRYI